MEINTGLKLKDSIIDYLITLKNFESEDIEKVKQLNEEEKISNGYLIKDAKISNKNNLNQYVFSCNDNNTKLRPGDSVNLLCKQDNKSYNAKIIENNFETISLSSKNDFMKDDVFDIEILPSSVLDAIISVAQSIEPGSPGFSFIKQLAGEEAPKKQGFSIVKDTLQNVDLNEEQLSITKEMLLRPSLKCLQGPPGTGKTKVLSAIANAFSNDGKEVLIISLTHQAVNNALNAIIKTSSNTNIHKIGDMIKTAGLNTKINKHQSYTDYLPARKKYKKNPNGAIVGMTFHSAMASLGLHSSGFNPSVILVDEAGQMPFYFGAIIGVLGAGSILFLGDDRQMPPIFHPKLESNILSKSIFTWICDKYPETKKVLSVTYRMNDEITKYVSEKFYEPYGINLESHSSIATNRLSFICKSNLAAIKNIFETQNSISKISVSHSIWKDYNIEEANFIYEIVLELFSQHISVNNFAIVTPYRRQVKTIRSILLEKGISQDQLPIIDTVERLQGQDVDIIIISFSVTDLNYYKENKSFIMNENRLNVMVSRAKRKVIILKGLIS